MKQTLALSFLFLIFTPSLSQGCSDAGFCTMGAMRPDQHYDKKIRLKLRSIEYNYYHGKTLLSPVINAHTIEANFSLNDDYYIHFKLPYMTTKGNLGKTKGVGDISFSVTRSITKLWGGEINVTLGTKIPTTNGAREDSVGRDWPMYQQPSLGTYDIIAGASFINRQWLIATGIQIPLNKIENEFRWSEWANNPNPELNYKSPDYVFRYNLATNLKRGTDVMLRVERNFRFINWNMSLGLLPIYRITRDEIFDRDSGERVKVDGTRGLALSALFGAGYKLNINNGIKFIFGKKLVDRDVNPDGLTREHVISISYIYRF